MLPANRRQSSYSLTLKQQPQQISSVTVYNVLVRHTATASAINYPCHYSPAWCHIPSILSQGSQGKLVNERLCILPVLLQTCRQGLCQTVESVIMIQTSCMLFMLKEFAHGYWSTSAQRRRVSSCIKLGCCSNPKL